MKQTPISNTRHALSAIALMAAGLYGAQVQAQAAPLQGATITVGPSCSLDSAIRSTNTNTDVGGCTALGSYGSGSVADTIVMPANNSVLLTEPAPNGDPGFGLPDVNSAIVILGNNNTIARSGNVVTPQFRIFNVSSSGNLTLNNLTITGGRINNRAGGGIGLGGGVLTLNNSTVTGNTAVSGNGGGIGTDSGGSTITLNNSTVSGNTAQGNGQSSAGNGGGIYAASSSLTLNNSTVSGNTATSGESRGGGVYYASGNSLTINNSTITNNNAAEEAGGLWYSGSQGSVKNSLIAGNTAPVRAAEVMMSGSNFQVNANNLFGHSGLTFRQAFFNIGPTSSFPGNNDLLGTSTARPLTPDPNETPVANPSPLALASTLSSTLASNGGPTQTHALVSGSAAVNASGTGATTADQRGFGATGVRDIGAYELNGADPDAPVDGSCGGAHTGATSTAPTGQALCSTGTATAVTGKSGAWGWMCSGSNGGSSSTCTAPYASQTLTLTVSPSSVTVGNATTATAQSTSGLKPTLQVSEKCSLGTSTDTATGVQASVTGNVEGECKVVAQQPGTGDEGDARFLSAEPVAAFVTVNPAPPAPRSPCDSFTRGANVIDLRSAPGGMTARGVNGQFNVIYGSAFNDTLTGGSAGNCIDGGAGADRLTAGAGDNSLYGGAGNDTLTPSTGSNRLDGGEGTDRCGRVSGRATASYASCELN